MWGPWTPIAALVACLLAVAGCGDDAPDRGGTTSMRGSTDTPASAPRFADAVPRSNPPCAQAARRPSDSRVRLDRARDRIDRAAAARTRSGGSFRTALTLRSGAITISGVLRGTRSADGDSRATLEWRGAAGLLLDDAELSIVDDQLAVRSGSDPEPRLLGSASGVALDVGRELLDHPFLLRERRANQREGVTTLVLDAPVAQLRAYATRERRGPVTELLRGARSLQLAATVDAGRLVRDRFTYVTTIPDAEPFPASLAGRQVTVTGETVRCD